LVTYKLEGESFSMRTPTGESYSAKLNGADAPYKGDSDANGVALRCIEKNTIEETAKLNGKAVSVTRLTVAPDGRSMIVSVKDLQDGSTNQFSVQKQ
jgi:hypothetical protein